MSDAEEYATHVAEDRQPENRMVAIVDAEGYMVRGVLLAPGMASDFLTFIRATRDAHPLPPEDLVMPPCWLLDEDGRGITTMEHAQLVRLAALLRLNDFAQHLTTYTRKAA